MLTENSSVEDEKNMQPETIARNLLEKDGKYF